MAAPDSVMPRIVHVVNLEQIITLIDFQILKIEILNIELNIENIPNISKYCPCIPGINPP